MEATRRDAAHVQRGAVTGFGERFVHGFVHGIVHHYIDSSLRFSSCMHAHVMRLMHLCPSTRRTRASTVVGVCVVPWACIYSKRESMAHTHSIAPFHLKQSTVYRIYSVQTPFDSSFIFLSQNLMSESALLQAAPRTATVLGRPRDELRLRGLELDRGVARGSTLCRKNQSPHSSINERPGTLCDTLHNHTLLLRLDTTDDTTVDTTPSRLTSVKRRVAAMRKLGSGMRKLGSGLPG